MAKLHELLAVDGNLDGQATKTRTELTATFEKKRHLFEEKRVTFQPIEEGAQPVTESQSDIQTSVAQEIEWISNLLRKSIDVSHQIDVANTVAKANILTEDGEEIAIGIPATSLLQLEKRVKEVHDLIVAIPTLDPAKGFSPDADRGKGNYKAREVRKVRTKKDQKSLVLLAPTKEHPGQAQMITVDVAVGTILEQEWSSLITPAMKADLIERSEILLRAIKKARARANEMEVDVTGNVIGKRLLDYVFKPLLG